MCDITIPKVQIGKQSGGGKKKKLVSYTSFSGVFYIHKNNEMNYLLRLFDIFSRFSPPKMTELEILILILPKPQ